MDLNPHDPEDLAVYTTDALETSELKAFEAHLDDGEHRASGTELTTLREVLGSLAALAAEPAPDELREQTLSAARSRRGIGTAIPEVADLPANEAYRRTIEALDGLLASLSPLDWDAPTIEGWTVKGLVTHLVAVEEYFGRQLGLWPLDIDEALEADHLEMTRAFVASWSGRTAAEVLARWRELTSMITTHLGSLERDAGRRPLHFHFLDTSLSTVLITRVFEVWTHDEDIRRATGRPLAAPEPARLRRMSRIAVPSMPFGLAMGGVDAAGRTARIVLTGPGGGTWDTALGLGETPGELEATVVVDVVDYCRLAARRLAPDEVHFTAEGDESLARQILSGAGVFSA